MQNKPEPITEVVFRKFTKPAGGGIIAMFPSLLGKVNDVTTCQSYMINGEHSSAPIDLIRYTMPATEEEYSETKKVLESYGYNLSIITKLTRKHYKIRKERYH